MSLDRRAECRLRVRDRNLDDEIGAAPLEPLGRLNAGDDVEVACGPATLAELALALEPDPGAVLDARRNLDRVPPGAPLATGAVRNPPDHTQMSKGTVNPLPVTTSAERTSVTVSLSIMLTPSRASCARMATTSGAGAGAKSRKIERARSERSIAIAKRHIYAGIAERDDVDLVVAVHVGQLARIQIVAAPAAGGEARAKCRKLERA